MSNDVNLAARQLWGQVQTSASGTSGASKTWCTPLILPTGGVIVFGNNHTSTLGARATFKLPCDSHATILSPDTTGNSTVIGFSEPFYASISPQIFALATATVISYILVILIFITPRTFYVGGPGGGSGFLSRSGLISGSYGSPTTVGVGRRPLLQKIATVTVAISLTIATSDTFNVASEQYYQGYTSSSQIVEEVVNSLEIRVIRVISDTFLWLAQVQTLIRLFPRHKEKVTIKWLGFAMVSFDTIFSILDSFVSQNTRTRPRSFQDAIPALSYLFELSISLIYASCVMYYSLSKRRFAFWHPKMRNVCLVALVSYISILIPVVFFVLDVSLPKLAGWGEYIRWVGAAAASVVVWEWVERIESLERDERKDGILGREIFDGDEMLDITPSEDERGRGGDGDVEKSAAFKFASTLASARAKLPIPRRRKRPAPQDLSVNAVAAAAKSNTNGAGPALITVPQSTTPPSRSDTTSASTVYAIRYHNLTSPSPGAPEGLQTPNTAPEIPEIPKEVNGSSTESAPSTGDKQDEPPPPASGTKQFFQTLSQPFKRRKAEPPPEVAGAQIASGMRRSPIDAAMNFKDRLGAFASTQKERFGGRNVSGQAAALPVMSIPAPRGGGRTWSPEDARHVSIGKQTTQTAAAAADDNNAGGEGRSTHSSSPSSSTAGDVITIPAPTEGKTWSPPDAHDPRKQHNNSANSRRSRDNDTPRSQQRVTPPGRNSTGEGVREQRVAVVSPPKVQLTPPVRASTAESRRSVGVRAKEIGPISEILGGSVPVASSASGDGTEPTFVRAEASASRPPSHVPVLRQQPSPPPQQNVDPAQGGEAAREPDPRTTTYPADTQQPANTSPAPATSPEKEQQYAAAESEPMAAAAQTPKSNTHADDSNAVNDDRTNHTEAAEARRAGDGRDSSGTETTT